MPCPENPKRRCYCFCRRHFATAWRWGNADCRSGFKGRRQNQHCYRKYKLNCIAKGIENNKTCSVCNDDRQCIGNSPGKMKNIPAIIRMVWRTKRWRSSSWCFILEIIILPDVCHYLYRSDSDLPEFSNMIWSNRTYRYFTGNVPLYPLAMVWAILNLTQ